MTNRPSPDLIAQAERSLAERRSLYRAGHRRVRPDSELTRRQLQQRLRARDLIRRIRPIRPGDERPVYLAMLRAAAEVFAWPQLYGGGWISPKDLD